MSAKYITTYTDGSGTEYEAIQISWDEVEELLGEPHDGSPEHDRRLTKHLLTKGLAPAWIKGAEGWVDEFGWGLKRDAEL